MPNIVFRNGVKLVDCVSFRAICHRTFASRTSDSVYTAILWSDGQPSCNCRGWATHKRCRHCVELMEDARTGILVEHARRLARFDRPLNEVDHLQQLVTDERRRQYRRRRESPPTTPPPADPPPQPYRKIRL